MMTTDSLHPTEICPQYGNEPTYIVSPPQTDGMSLDEYQRLALETAIYPFPIIYPALEICGEAGEIADKVKKILRDNSGDFGKAEKLQVAYEIGDVLWGLATLSHDLGFTLGEVARMNYEKLHSRKLRGKLGGSGDNR